MAWLFNKNIIVYCYIFVILRLNCVFGNHDGNSTVSLLSTLSTTLEPTASNISVAGVTTETPTKAPTEGPTESPTEAPIIPTERECRRDETKYTYTPCDENNHRWRVDVPKVFNQCRITGPSIPVPGKSCGYTCSPGQYLDIGSQSCMSCKAGTYSVGGSITFSKWDVSALPEGFKTWGMNPDDDSPDDDEESQCKTNTWHTNGKYIASSGDECKSVLVYSVDLERDGVLAFSYRSQTDSSYFHVYAVNGYCSENYNQKHQLFPKLSTGWKVETLKLNKGRNLIFWEAAYFNTDIYFGASTDKTQHNYESSAEKMIEIRHVTVSGLPYKAICQECPAGTYSGPGSSICKVCEKDTFSLADSNVCTQCKRDEYADPGASVCAKRPACTINDYYETWTSCDDDMMTEHIYDWVKPKICNSDVSGSVSLPPSPGKVRCPPCNPGQFKNGSSCSFCPKGQYGSGSSACKPCPVSTTPKVGIYLQYWSSITSNSMTMGCFSKFERACKSEKGWELSQNFADSGSGHSDDAELVMLITVPKFTKEHSLFIIEFDMSCTSKCLLTLQEYHYAHGLHTVRSWKGPTSKTKFIHHVKSSDQIRFRLSFEKPYNPKEEKTYNHKFDRVRLYSMNITNAENGGANECEKCELRTSELGCITCGKGEYLSKRGEKCKTCPNGSFFNNTISSGLEGCQECPTGTIVNPSGTGCYSTCKINFDGRDFDFSSLSGPVQMRGANLFTGKGFPYYHMFNISICGMKNSNVECMNNVTIGKDGNLGASTKVTSAICRSTVIPSKKEGNIMTQSVSLADNIGEIHYGGNMDALINPSFRRAIQNTSMVTNSTHEDIHFIFQSSTITPHCTSGFRSVVTLRCDPTAIGRGVVKPLQKCPMGTCDGCLFTFVWHTEFACPICTSLDYKNLTTACKDGKVHVHHIWKNNPRMCRGGDKLPEDDTRACTIFETPILDFKIFLFIFLCLAVLLCLTVVILCYRNRRLRYKYHRLVDGASMADGELPAVEKCALDDDEDDDEVILARNPRGTNHILDRLKKFKGNGKNNFDEFESMQMGSTLSDDEFSH